MISPALRLRRLLRRLRRDTGGVTLVEFAFVGPVLILMIIGLFDIAHTQYTNSVLYGAMQKAGRDFTLEGALTQQTNIDGRVRDQLQTVMPNGATISFEKRSFAEFSDVNEPEQFTDQNGDGICNNNEPYVDSNENQRWDAIRGFTGVGGARDVQLYTATVSYPRLLPMYGMIGLPQTITLRASTVLRIQPYDQQRNSTRVRNC